MNRENFLNGSRIFRFPVQFLWTIIKSQWRTENWISTWSSIITWSRRPRDTTAHDRAERAGTHREKRICPRVSISGDGGDPNAICFDMLRLCACQIKLIDDTTPKMWYSFSDSPPPPPPDAFFAAFANIVISSSSQRPATWPLEH